MQKEIEEKKQKRNENAQFWPFAATLQSVVIIDQNGDDFFTSAGGFGTKEGEVSFTAMNILSNVMSTGGGVLVEQPTMYDMGLRLFGLKIRDRMRIMALDALRFMHTTGKNEPHYMIPVGLWNHKAFESAPWADPCDIIIPSELRNDISWDGLCSFLNIDVSKGVDLDTNARLQAEIARQIVLKSGLVCE